MNDVINNAIDFYVKQGRKVTSVLNTGLTLKKVLSRSEWKVCTLNMKP